LRVGGAIAGSTLGGAAGSIVPGAGTLAGGVTGGAVGGGVGEFLAEEYEKLRGIRKEINPTQVAPSSKRRAQRFQVDELLRWGDEWFKMPRQARFEQVRPRLRKARPRALAGHRSGEALCCRDDVPKTLAPAPRDHPRESLIPAFFPADFEGF
jgi:hypothetical protein